MPDRSCQDNQPVRRKAWFKGQVQGVGFRYTTYQTATRFEVVGTVRNLRDGSVELIAEGFPVTLEQFIHAVQQAMSGHITHTEIFDSPPTGEFSDFKILMS